MIHIFNLLFIRCVVFTSLFFAVFTVQAQFSGGAGTVADPFRVSTLDDLRTLSENDEYWQDHFILVNDIDATPTRNWNVDNGRPQGFSPIGNRGAADNPFTGSFDGQGYEISNLYIDQFREFYVGLFGRTSGATIESLGLVNCEVNGLSDVGGLVGYGDNTVLKNCYATGTIESQQTMAGGLIGIHERGTIAQCYTHTQVQAQQVAGGLAGFSVESEVNDSFAFGAVAATGSSAGGLISFCISSTIRNSYAEVGVAAGSANGAFISVSNESRILDCFFNSEVTPVSDPIYQDDGNQTVTGLTSAEFVDQSTFENAGWDFQDIWEMSTLPAFAATQRPYLKQQLYDHRVKVIVFPASASRIIGQSFYNTGDPVTLEAQPGAGFTFLRWEENGTVVSQANPYNFTCTGNVTYTALFLENVPFPGGIGTEADPYQITTIEQLQSINTMPTLLARHYVLTSDIDASATRNWNGGAGFDPIASRHPVEGERVFTGTLDGQGHRIEHLFIQRPDQNKVGLIAQSDQGVIKNLGLYDTEIQGKDTVGGFVAYYKGSQGPGSSSVSANYVSGRLGGNNFTGGLLGFAENVDLVNCYSTAQVIGADHVGGLIGWLQGVRKTPSIRESYAAGPVLALENSGALISGRRNVSMSRNVYDRQASLQDQGTSTGDGAGGITSLGTTLFADTFYIQTLGGLALGTDWKLAYTHDHFLRPVLPWETTPQYTFVSSPGGALRGDSLQLVVEGRNTASVQAVADNNAVFAGWESAGSVISSDNPLRLQAGDTDQTIKALFTQRTGSFQATFSITGGAINQPGTEFFFDNTAYTPNSNNEFIITHLENGTYTYKVSVPNFKVVEGSITINNADVTETISLEVAPSQSFPTTFFVKEGPQPVENAVVGVINTNTPPDTVFQTTDGLGRAVFAGLPFGSYSYFVAANALDTTDGSFLVSPGDANRIDVAMVATYTATLRFSDGTNPVREGGVLFNSGRGNIYYDLAGRDFSQDLLLPGTYTYKMTSHGYLDEEGSFTIVDQDIEQVIILSPRTTPVFRVRFNVTDGFNPVPSFAFVTINGQSYSINNGHAEAVNLEPGAYPYMVNALGYRPFRDTLEITNADLVENVTIVSNSNAPKFDVTFVITDGTQPIKEAQLLIRRGVYQLEEVDNGRVNVFDLFRDTEYPYTIFATGYQPYSGKIVFDGTDVVENVVLLPVLPTYSMTFRITNGRFPLDKARVNFDGTEYSSNNLGEVVIPRVTNGTYSYSVSLQGYTTASGSVTVSDADQTEEVVLSLTSIPTYALTFRVSDGANALSNAVIDLEGTEYRSDAAGEAVILGLVNGTYNYSISLQGYTTVNGAVTVSDADQTEEVTLSLVSTPTYTLTFRVSDDTNAPLNAVVNFEGIEYRGNSPGEIMIPGLMNGVYTYFVALDGYETINRSVTINGSDVLENVIMNLTTLPTYTLTFRVTGGPGVLVNALINVQGADYFSSDAGAVMIPGLPSGTYSYRVSLEGYQTVEGSVTIENADKTEEVTLITHPPSTHTLSFLVTGNDDPLENARITLAQGAHFTDDQGRVEISGLTAGTYEYAVFKEGHSQETGTVTLTDRDVEIEIQMSRVILNLDDPLADALRVYPVPAQDYIVLEGLQPSKEYTLQLHSAQGKQQILFEGRVQDRVKIDVSDFKPGMFVLMLVDEHGNQWSRRVSKR